MKRFLFIALFMSSTLVIAAENPCLVSCKEMAAECDNQCVKNVKKKNPGAMPQCASQCKQLVAECEKECANEAPTKR